MIDLLKGIRDACPEVHQILEDAQKGEISTEEALAKVGELGSDALNSLSLALGNIQAEQKDRGLFYTGRGLPKINPVYEAALIERAQFDGDMPELRTGPLPEGVAPAVRVQTTAINPVVLGLLLKRASDETLARVEEHEKARLIALSETPEEALEKAGSNLMVELWGSDKTDTSSYPRGTVPAPVALETPDGASLLALSDKDVQRASWGFVSTTQGRRSVLDPITDQVKSLLRAAGVKVVVLGGRPTEAALIAQHQWVVQITGERSQQPRLNHVGVASKCLAQGLLRNLPGIPEGCDFGLLVSSVDRLSDREVGWGAYLYEV